MTTTPWVLAREFEPFGFPERLPVFVLQDVVMFPHTLMPLHVFEPRYREMVSDVLDEKETSGNGLLAIGNVTPREAGGGIGGEGPPLAPIAGVAKVVGFQPMEDGRSNILLLGVGRVRLTRYVEVGTSYYTAECELLPPRETRSMRGDAGRQLADELIWHTSEITEMRELPGVEQLNTPDVPLDAVLDQLSSFPLISARERQSLLEERNPVQRTSQLLSALGCIAVMKQIPS